MKTKSKITFRTLIWKAFRLCWHNVTKTRKGGILRRTSIALGETIRCRVDCSKSRSGTAYYYHKDGVNYIHVQESLADVLFKDGLNNKLKTEGVRQVIRHECGHALFTPRGRKLIDDLKAHGIPFDLYNLFEDCRIEYKLTSAFKGADGLFYWKKYIDIETTETTPCGLLYNLKLKEAGARVDRSKTLKVSKFLAKFSGDKKAVEFRGKIVETPRLVAYFYRNIIQTKDADIKRMLSILQEWVKVFGADVPPSTGGGSFISSGDLDESATAEAGERGEYVDGETETKAETETETKADKSGTHKSGSKIARTLPKKCRAATVRQSDINYSRRIASQLVPIIKRAKIKPCTLGKRGRLYIPRIMCGLAQAFRSHSEADGKRNIYLLVDLSGSMAEIWHKYGGKNLVAAFTILRDMGLINLSLYYTAEIDEKRTTVNASLETVKDVLSINPRGAAEMIKASLDETAEAVKSADACFIFTDADIVDEPVKPNEWRSKGVDLCGVCINPKEAHLRPLMRLHFSRSFIHATAAQLARRIVDYTVNR